jgi:hypothetical protein
MDRAQGTPVLAMSLPRYYQVESRARRRSFAWFLPSEGTALGVAAALRREDAAVDPSAGDAKETAR